MTRFPFIAQRLFNAPLAIHPGKAEAVVGALAERLGIASLTRISGEEITLPTLAFDGDGEGFSRPGRIADAGYDNVAGAAVIQVCGTLVQKLGTARPYSGMSGYDSIRAAFLCALEDTEAKAIVLAIDSPGGEVAGLFDLADEIYAARGEKPIWAILDEAAYSAAYALASAADRIIVPRTGGVGSIGVVAAHVDYSKALAGAGIVVTFIQSGARKTDGASEKPLSDEALGRFQADIDQMADLFFETVARNRGISIAKIRGMEAGTFLGPAGVEQGLADAVMAPDAAFRELLASLA
jgi:signal peptide peptidase SppA